MTAGLLPEREGASRTFDGEIVEARRLLLLTPPMVLPLIVLDLKNTGEAMEGSLAEG
jgi:hypothetical protein